MLIFPFERYKCSELASNIKIGYKRVWLVGVCTLNRSYRTWTRTLFGARPDRGFFFISSPNTQGFNLTMLSRDDIFVSLEFFCYRTDLKPEKLQATIEEPVRRASAATFSEIPFFLGIQEEEN